MSSAQIYKPEGHIWGLDIKWEYLQEFSLPMCSEIGADFEIGRWLLPGTDSTTPAA